MLDPPMACIVENPILQSSNDQTVSNTQFTNLTGRFIQIRSSSTNNDVIVNVTLPPLWLDALEESGRLINQLSDLIGKLEMAHQKRLLDVFGTDPKLGASVECITKQIVTTFKRCQQSLKDVCPLFAKPGASELIFCDNARKTYNRGVEKLSEQFKSLQKNYISKISRKSAIESVIDVENKKISSSFSGDMLDFDINDLENATSSINDIKGI